MGGSILFDVNEDGKFDVLDASYVFRYIMGNLDVDIVDTEHEIRK